MTRLPLSGSAKRPLDLPWLCALALAAALVSSSAVAQVSPADKAAAEGLFEEGRKLAAAGNYSEAVAKFEASHRLDAGLGTLLYLADAYEKAGRTASAWVTFREAAGLAKQTSQGERETVARNRAATLEGKLARLTIALDPAADVPGLEVRRNGATLKRELFGAPVPVDPGTYLVEASAPGKKPFSTKIEVPSEPGNKSVTIEKLVDAEPVAGPAGITGDLGPTTDPKASPSKDDPPRDTAEDGSGRRVLGLVIGGIGIAGLATGGVLVAVALSKDSEADDHCDGVVCRDQEGQDLSDSANTFADVAGIAIGIGAAALVGGAVIFLTAPSGTARADAAQRAARWQLAPAVGWQSAGLTMRGAF